MNSRWAISFFAAFAFLTLSGAVAGSESLSGWRLTAQNGDGFEASRDENVTFRGKPTARLRTSVATADLGSLGQSIDAGEHRNRRIRFATSARTKGVKGWTGLWLRIESIDTSFLAYADTHDVHLREDSDWTPLTIVIDVPDKARAVYFGLTQEGPGTSWFGPVTVETVDRNVPVSYNTGSRNFATEPLSCSRAAPTGSHIPQLVCYNHKTGRTSYLANLEYVHGALLSGTRLGTPRGWLWIWG